MRGSSRKRGNLWWTWRRAPSRRRGATGRLFRAAPLHAVYLETLRELQIRVLEGAGHPGRFGANPYDSAVARAPSDRAPGPPSCRTAPCPAAYGRAQRQAARRAPGRSDRGAPTKPCRKETWRFPRAGALVLVPASTAGLPARLDRPCRRRRTARAPSPSTRLPSTLLLPPEPAAANALTRRRRRCRRRRRPRGGLRPARIVAGNNEMRGVYDGIAYMYELAEGVPCPEIRPEGRATEMRPGS